MITNLGVKVDGMNPPLQNSSVYLLYPELFEPCMRQGVLTFKGHADALENLV